MAANIQKWVNRNIVNVTIENADVIKSHFSSWLLGATCIAVATANFVSSSVRWGELIIAVPWAIGSCFRAVINDWNKEVTPNNPF